MKSNLNIENTYFNWHVTGKVLYLLNDFLNFDYKVFMLFFKSIDFEKKVSLSRVFVLMKIMFCFFFQVFYSISPEFLKHYYIFFRFLPIQCNAFFTTKLGRLLQNPHPRHESNAAPAAHGQPVRSQRFRKLRRS